MSECTNEKKTIHKNIKTNQRTYTNTYAFKSERQSGSPAQFCWMSEAKQAKPITLNKVNIRVIQILKIYREKKQLTNTYIQMHSIHLQQLNKNESNSSIKELWEKSGTKHNNKIKRTS